MSNQDSQEKPAKRGDAAWKEVREKVAARNEQASKTGREAREKGDRVRAAARQAAEVRRDAGLNASLKAGRRTP